MGGREGEGWIVPGSRWMPLCSSFVWSAGRREGGRGGRREGGREGGRKGGREGGKALSYLRYRERRLDGSETHNVLVVPCQLGPEGKEPPTEKTEGEGLGEGGRKGGREGESGRPISEEQKG